MIERKDLFHIPFYKKTCFCGSYLGMRYNIARHTDEEDKNTFLVSVFPGPYSYDHTAPELMTKKSFDFNDEALDEICSWLNEQYQQFPDKWEMGRIIY